MKKTMNPSAAYTCAHPPFTVGPMAYGGVADAMRPYGLRGILIGGQKALAAGFYPLQEAVTPAGVTLAVQPFVGEATVETAQEMAEAAKSFGADVILGMGGGRAIDTAKAAAHYTGKPVITLPTIPATCAATTALSVLHHPGLSAYDPFLFLDAPPRHVFLHTGILAAAPAMYLRAGIGDSAAKHVEAVYKAGQEQLSYNDRLGLSIARMGYEGLMEVGEEALGDAQQGKDSVAFRLACQLCVINTGLVSLLVQDRFNGGLAHALYYALHELPQLAGNLHGDLVAWGSVVQLCLEGKEDKARALKRFIRALGIPATLGELGLNIKDANLLALLPQALKQQDMADIPYPVDVQMLVSAISSADAL